MLTIAEFAGGAARFRAAGITLRTNHYRTQLASTRAKRAATFDALIASMLQSVLGLEIALHKVSRHQLEEATHG